jgi:HEAT repeat protein
MVLQGLAVGRETAKHLSAARVVPVLIEALASENSNVRRFAAFGLRRIGRKAAAAEKALHDGLRDSDPGARIAAAEAYWSVSGKADEPVRVLRAVIQPAGTWIIQMGAANALAEIGPAAKAAVPELIACLASDTRHVVASSAKALGGIGPDAASAVPALTTQLEKSDDQYTRVCLVRALWRINRSERTLPVLQDALTNSRDFMALSEAAEAIGEMGHQAAAAAPLLQPLVKDSSSHVRNAAAEALKHLERN